MFDTKKYTIGWICALQTELVAAQVFLDEIHDQAEYGTAQNDNNAYVFGSIGGHNVVVAALPSGEYGTNSAAGVARDLVRSFTNVRVALMVGIGGGAPLVEDDGEVIQDIRLGDVVVSKPTNGTGGVWQYDLGKAIQDRDFKPTGHLNQPPTSLLAALTALSADIEMRGHNIDEDVSSALLKWLKLKKKYKRPDASTDRLYKSSFLHQDDNAKCSVACNAGEQIVIREERDEDEESVVIHHGIIASGNTLLKDATLRDKFARDSNVLCFEMEAAGLMNQFPFLVIRGICDYSDTHKNKEWQGFAALTAACFARKLLLRVPPNKVEAEVKLSELKEIQEGLQNVSQKVDFVASQVQQQNVDSLRSDIQSWLGAANPATNFHTALKARHEGSGIWILQDDTFKAWLSKDISFLWLYGNSGCGKTVISSTIIEHLLTASRETKEPVVYFYFDIQDQGKQGLDKALRSLISQVCSSEGHERSRKLLTDLYNSCRSGFSTSQPTTAQLQDCFRAICRDSPFTVLLDALDECAPLDFRKDLLAWIKDATFIAGLRIVVTSRPEPDIMPAFEDERYQKVEIKGDAQDCDIRTFIEFTVDNRSGDFSRWEDRPIVREHIKSSLTAKAGGMFRWAACQLDVLKTCLDPFELESALNSLPKTLEETYERILENLPVHYRDNALRILQFLAYAQRPLTSEELVDVCATRLDREPAFHADYKIARSSELARYCGSLIRSRNENLVEPDERSVKLFEEYDRAGRFTLLELSHASVKEYLLSNSPKGPFKDGFLAHCAKECIVRVSLLCLDNDYQLAKTLTPEMRPLRQFAAKYWYDFVPSDERADRGVLKWICDRTVTEGFCDHLMRIHHVGDSSETPRSILYVAAYKGLEALVKTLLTEGHSSQGEEGGYGNPLQAASYHGDTGIVQALINHHADVNAKGGEFGSALQAASTSGHLEVVTLLLNSGADVNAEGGLSSNALSAAIENGQSEVCQLLLQSGAEANTKGGFWGNALQAACFGGHLDIMKILLRTSTQSEACGECSANAVGEVANRGSQLSRSQGADVSIGCPLAAVLKPLVEHDPARDMTERLRSLEMVELLIGAGANIDVAWPGRGTPLQLAAAGGLISIVQLLLAQGADVNFNGWP